MTDLNIKSNGDIFLEEFDYRKPVVNRVYKNKVLLTGRNALAKMLANAYTGTFQFYIARVLFGNNGTIGGNPRLVDDTRTGLFGPTILAKPVLATIDDNFPQQVTFTTTIAYTELVNQTINEMALEMATGDLFSMATFGDVTKTSSMQLVWNWRITWV